MIKELDPNFSMENQNILMPVCFDNYIGQNKIKKELKTYIKSAKVRGVPNLDHALISGSPGMGKTTVAHVLANEMGVKIHTAIAPAIERPEDIVSILLTLKEGEILFIEEIHELKGATEELLYSAMEDYKIDIITEDSGDSGVKKTFTLNLPKFTLIGATTKQGLISRPLLDRFGIKQVLSCYSNEELLLILQNNSKKMNIKFHDEGLMEIAKRSLGTPRIANNLLSRTRDFAVVDNNSLIDKNLSLFSLNINDAMESFVFDFIKTFFLEVESHEVNDAIYLLSILSVVEKTKDAFFNINQSTIKEMLNLDNLYEILSNERSSLKIKKAISGYFSSISDDESNHEKIIKLIKK